MVRIGSRALWILHSIQSSHTANQDLRPAGDILRTGRFFKVDGAGVEHRF